MAPPAGQVDEGEDQPFVVTPEYEALANARFEEAIRSGAMQASMTPAALSPGLAGAFATTGANGYFAAAAQATPPSPPPDRGNIAPAASGAGLTQNPGLPQPNYTYPLAQAQADMHAYMYQLDQQGQGQPSANGSDLAAAAGYYSPPGSSNPGQQWYGP